MNQLEKLAALANKLHEDEPNPIVMPITRIGKRLSMGITCVPQVVASGSGMLPQSAGIRLLV
jgi:hypothetical protein